MIFRQACEHTEDSNAQAPGVDPYDTDVIVIISSRGPWHPSGCVSHEPAISSAQVIGIESILWSRDGTENSSSFCFLIKKTLVPPQLPTFYLKKNCTFFKMHCQAMCQGRPKSGGNNEAVASREDLINVDLAIEMYGVKKYYKEIYLHKHLFETKYL